MVQTGKRLKCRRPGYRLDGKKPAMRETWVQPLGQKDPLEKGMATHSSILAWRIPMDRGPGGLPSIHVTKESDVTLRHD